MQTLYTKTEHPHRQIRRMSDQFEQTLAAGPFEGIDQLFYQRPEVLQESYQQQIALNYVEPVLLIDKQELFQAFNAEQAKGQKIESLIKLNKYISLIKANRTEQFELLQKIDLYSLLQSGLIYDTGQQYRLELFKIFTAIVSIGDLYYPLFSILISEMLLSCEIIYQMIAFEFERTNQAGIITASKFTCYNDPGFMNFVHQQRLLVKMSQIMQQRHLPVVVHQAFITILIGMVKWCSPSKKLSQVEFNIALSYFLFANKHLKKELAKSLLGSFCQYLKVVQPIFMAEYESKVYEVLTEAKHYPSEFMYLLKWTIRTFGVNVQKIDQFVEMLAFYSQNEDLSKHHDIYSVTSVIIKYFKQLPQASQIHLKTIFQCSVQTRVPKTQKYKYYMVKLYLRSLQFKKYLLKPSYSSKLLQNLSIVLRNTSKNMKRVLGKNVLKVAKSLINFMGRNEQRCLTANQKIQLIKRIFEYLDQNKLKALISVFLKATEVQKQVQ